jgi:hypothetical protein
MYLLRPNILGQFVILRRALKYIFIRMKCATLYNKKSIKLYWSQIRQIYQGKKIREKRICQSQQQRPTVAATEAYSRSNRGLE